jgi:hypothetical protein
MSYGISCAYLTLAGTSSRLAAVDEPQAGEWRQAWMAPGAAAIPSEGPTC